MNKYLCIHGHFYQPPRENPWLEEVELQSSAYPYHDWNERIAAECYAPNGASRLLDSSRKIIDIVNNYSQISFNFGPTLLSWMEKKEPENYQLILEADKLSRERFSGHGSAIAQVYNHLIMPLANSRDKRTQVIWGIQDFESRFRRKPEGMWLAETAVDLETLEILVDQGVKFTILAPRQAKRFRKKDENAFWWELNGHSIESKVPYECLLPSGKKIAIFFYDGVVSQGVAFEGLLANGETFAKRLCGIFDSHNDGNQLVHIATDGETYGHHHRFGEMALAYCLHYLEANKLAQLTIYGEYLEKFPPEYEVQIHENSSWSCYHGIERWKSDCGCNSGGHAEWNQKWRQPLREALDWLRDQAIPVYEQEMSSFTPDVWRLRDRYIELILDRSPKNIDRFFKDYFSQNLSEDEKVKILRLLEMQRNALLMYTSCGWFFDEISGIETVQVIKYAGRTLQLVFECAGKNLEAEFVALLEKAPSNLPAYKNGGYVYQTMVKPSIVDLLRVAAHYAISSLFDSYPQRVKVYCYSVTTVKYDMREAGRMKLAVGYGWIQSEMTLRKRLIAFAVLHLGDHNFVAGVDHLDDDKLFRPMQQRLFEAFSATNVPLLIKRISEYFGDNSYSLWHLFKHEQQVILDRVLQSAKDEIETAFRQIYEHHYPLMQIRNELQVSLPKSLTTVVEYILNRDLCEELEREDLDMERIKNLMEDIKRFSFGRDKMTLSYVAGKTVYRLMFQLVQQPENLALLEVLEAVLSHSFSLGLEPNLWRAQNLYYSLRKTFYSKKLENAERDDLQAKRWVDLFNLISLHLQIKV